MKRLNKFIFALAAMGLAFSACTDDEISVGGEPDVDGCYGVYFPNQAASGDHTLTPSEETTVVFQACRTNTKGAITVPLAVSDTSAAKIFEVGTLSFADGQSESSVTVTFPKSGVGVRYALELAITDPQYASKYAEGSYAVSYSVLREKWNSLGKARFREDFMTTFFGVENVEYEVEIEENDNVPGYYRLVNVYGEAYPYNEPGDWDDTRDYYIYIHAEKPNAVYLAVSGTGMDWGYGEVYVGSIAGLRIANGQTLASQIEAGMTGTLEDGIITFPEQSLLVGMAEYNDGGLYPANGSGRFRVVLPGVTLTDYSLKVNADYCADGNVPVDFTAGVDVASVKYAVYEGVLDNTAINKRVNAIIAGTDASETFSEFVLDEETEKLIGGVDVSLSTSGDYTLVAVSYDKKGESHVSAHTFFKYVAPEDEGDFAVDVHMGIEDVSDRYAGAGFDNTNSIAYYVYGSELKEVHIACVETEKYLDDPDTYNNRIKNSIKPVPDSVLTVMNAPGGYAALFTGLSALRSYTVLVWATNGTMDKIMTAERTTTGLPNVLLGTGTYVYGSGVFDEDPDAEEHYFEEGISLYSNPNVKNAYVISPWGFEAELVFSMDKAEEKDGRIPIHIEESFTGETDNDGYLIYAMEASDYEPSITATSYYDVAKDEYNFAIAYVAVNPDNGEIDGHYAVGMETFSNDESAVGASVKAVSFEKGFTPASRKMFVSPRTIAVERNYRPVEVVSTSRQVSVPSVRKADKSVVLKAEAFK